MFVCDLIAQALCALKAIPRENESFLLLQLDSQGQLVHSPINYR